MSIMLIDNDLSNKIIGYALEVDKQLDSGL